MKKKPILKKKTWLCRSCNKQVVGNRYANAAKGIMECVNCTGYLKGQS